MVQFMSHCTYLSLYARVSVGLKFQLFCLSIEIQFLWCPPADPTHINLKYSHALIKHMCVRAYAWKEVDFIQCCGVARRFCVVSVSYWKAAANTSLTVVVPKHSGYDACPDKEES